MHMEDQKIREDARKIMDAALHAALPDTCLLYTSPSPRDS